MSVTNGQPANEDTFNDGFLSRTDPSDTLALQTFKGGIAGEAVANAAATGSDQSVALTKVVTIFTNAGLVSINNLTFSDLTAAPLVMLKNALSTIITLKNNTGGTAAHRILTGTGADLGIAPGQTLLLVYDNVNSRWQVIGSLTGKATTGTKFTIANNNGSQDVTGLVFLSTEVRSAEFKWQVFRSATGGLTRAQRGSCMVIWNGTAWEIVYGPMTPTDAGVGFAIDGTSGQVNIGADDNTGTYDAALSYLTWEIINSMGI